jgi:hypothetical protein
MNFTMLFCMKFVLIGHSQVALSAVGCHLQVALSGLQKSFEKATCKNVDEIDPCGEFHQHFWCQSTAAFP